MIAGERFAETNCFRWTPPRPCHSEEVQGHKDCDQGGLEVHHLYSMKFLQVCSSALADDYEARIGFPNVLEEAGPWDLTELDGFQHGMQ